MKLKIVSVLSCALLYCFSSQAFAITCTNTNSWGNLSAPGTRNFGQSFSSSGNYANCYTFSLSNTVDASGGLSESDPWLNKLDIDVSAVSLFSGGVVGNNTVGSVLFSDPSPTSFSFANLSLGTYSFVVFTNVTSGLGLFNSAVSYAGTINTVARPGTPIAVPEPTSLAIFGIGLLLVAAARRRTLRGTR